MESPVVINVVQSDGTGNVGLEFLSPTDQETAINEMYKIYKNIFPEYRLQSLLSCVREYSLRKADAIYPDIPELCIKQIVNLAAKLTPKNYVAVPIIVDFPARLENIHTQKMIKNNARQYLTGRKKKILGGEVSNAYNIKFDKNIHAITQDGFTYIISAGEEVLVSGIIVEPLKRDGSMARQEEELLENGLYNASLLAKLSGGKLIKSLKEFYIYSKNFEPVKFKFGTPKLNEFLFALFEYLNGENNYINKYGPPVIYNQITEGLEGAGPVKYLKDNVIKYEAREIADKIDLGEKAKIVARIEAILSIALEKHNAITFANDINNLQFALFYHLPPKNQYIEKYLSTMEQDVTKQKLLRETEERENKQVLLAQNYIDILRLRLKSARFSNLMAQLEKSAGDSLAQRIVKLLTTEEKKILETAYAEKMRKIQFVANNKCAHRKLLLDFHHSAKNTGKQSELFTKLLTFVEHPIPKDAYIKCKVCHLDLMCPHTYDVYTKLFGAKNIVADINKYIDYSIENADAFYCKICSEHLKKLSFSDDGASTYNKPDLFMNEEMKKEIWSELVSLQKYIRCGPLININKLFDTIREKIYTWIVEFDRTILKLKTISNEEVKARKRIYITTTALAWLVHMMNTLEMSPESSVTFVGYDDNVGPKNRLSSLVKHAVNIIMVSKNILLREVPNLTKDVITNHFITSYKSVSSRESIDVHFKIEATDLITNIILDPFYKDLAQIHRLAYMAANNKGIPSPVKIADLTLGMHIDVDDPRDKTPLFDKAKLPAFKVFQDTRNSKALQWRKILYDGSTLLLDRIKTGLFTKSLYVASDDRYVISGELKNYYSALEKLRAEERALILENFKKNKMLLYPLARKARPVQVDTSIARLYDENAQKHKWDIFIVKGAADANIEMKTADFVLALITKGEKVARGQIIDKKCSVCHILKSKLGTLDEKKIYDSIDSTNKLTNFFRFYESRCPRGGLHDLFDSNNSETCKKCGLKLGANQSSVDSLNYYREYKGVYAQERAELAKSMKRARTDDATVTQRGKDKAPKTYTDLENWTFNYNIILEFSDKLKINHNLLMALTSHEGQKYEDIVNGAHSIPAVESKDNHRIYMMKSYLNTLYTEYRILKNFNKIVQSQQTQLSTLLMSTHKPTPMDLNTLPAIPDDYNDRIAFMARTYDAQKMFQYLLQTLYEYLLIILNHGHEQTQRLRRDFVFTFISKILRQEENTTKPGYFNRSVIYGQSGKESADTEAEMGDDEGGGEGGEMGDDDELEDVMDASEAYDMEDPDDEDQTLVRVEGID